MGATWHGVFEKDARGRVRGGVRGVLLAWPAAAQETVAFGSVSGRVVDAQGAVVPAARVTARHLDTNQSSRSNPTARAASAFRTSASAPYEIVVSRAGFADATRTLTVTVASAFELPVALQLAGFDTTVQVAAAVPVIEAARSQLAGTVLRQEIRDRAAQRPQLPRLALLVPGVAPPNVGGNQLFAETSAVPGVGLSVSSQRNFSNNFIVDGLSANDDAAGLSSIPVGVDAVEQLQVVTSGGHAELGRALGGFVNVITRSGTNVFHGDVYGFFRDRALNAPNALDRHPPADDADAGRRQPSAGRFRRDRTVLLRQLRAARSRSGRPHHDRARQRRGDQRAAAAAAYPGSPVDHRPLTRARSRPAQLLAKADHQVSGRDQMSARLLLYDVEAPRARGAGALSAPTASAGSRQPRRGRLRRPDVHVLESHRQRGTGPGGLGPPAGAARRSRSARR